MDSLPLQLLVGVGSVLGVYTIALELNTEQLESFLLGIGIGLSVFALGSVVTSHSYTNKTAEKPRSEPSIKESGPPQTPHHVHVLSQLQGMFELSTSQLQRIVKQMLWDMHRGLEKDNEAIKMLPTHVCHLPKGTEAGSYLALDLGGTNFRVCVYTLDGKGGVEMRQSKFMIADAVKTGEGAALFDFIADCVKQFFVDHQATLSNGVNHKWKLGFCFSFPVNQVSINEGSLLVWTKGFTASNVVGENAVKLLQDAFTRKSLNIEVSALVNDTTGTLMSLAYSKPSTCAGMILGTGSNCAYIEKIENIIKYKGSREGISEMLINMEWGGFDDTHIVIPRTKYDYKLDSDTPTPGTWTFEQLISGLYLGEIVRIVLVDLADQGDLFENCGASPELKKKNAFETAYMSKIEIDNSHDLTKVKHILEVQLGIKHSTLIDRRIVKSVCALVGTRSARLAAAGVAAVVTKMNKLATPGCIVGIDGSLFELYPNYQNRMRSALVEMLGMCADNITLEQARDGSGQGAALIAALAEE